MFVRYVGSKSTAFDPFFGTGGRWDGHGSVDDIDDEKRARKLIKAYPHLWEAADGPETLPDPASDAQAGKNAEDQHPILAVKHSNVPLSAANASTLRAWAKEHMGLQIDAAVSAGEAREQIVAHAASLQAEGLDVPGLDDE